MCYVILDFFTVMFYIRGPVTLDQFCLMGHDIRNKKVTIVSSEILLDVFWKGMTLKFHVETN